MKKKLQVFVSSTYLDLKEERSNAVRLILLEGHIPTGMEVFGQDDREQWEVIRAWIDASDVYLIILKDRYGSVCENTGKSYTQMEYEYACSQGKPIIEIVIGDEVNRGKSDDYEKMVRFRSMVMKNHVTTPIHDEIEFSNRITGILHKYQEELTDGWCRYEEVRHAEEKYDLICSLMLPDGRDNAFTVAPKIIMMMDKMQKYNEVKIARLEAHYKINSGKNGEKIFDGEREWIMRDITNVSGSPIESFSFFTATDIGNRADANVNLSMCVEEKTYILDEYTRRHGISCWNWKVEPRIGDHEMINDMVIKEQLGSAWDFENREWEIVYFIPKCFGRDITHVHFQFETDDTVPLLEMDLYMVYSDQGTTKRKMIRQLSRTKCQNGHKYGVDLTGAELNMDNFYYIQISVIQ